MTAPSKRPDRLGIVVVVLAAVLAVVYAPVRAIDHFANFARVTLSAGYDASATSVVVVTGQVSVLSTPPFNCTWSNATDYPDPTNDPNREIVRVTAIVSNTLSLTRAQESTTAKTHNAAGKTHRLDCGLTAKTLTEIAAGLAAPVITGGTCTNQAATAVGTNGAPTCTTLTSAYVDSSIAATGTDINTSNQVTATHLASALPVAQGGTGDATLTAHGVLIGATTSAIAATSAGTAGQLLQSNGASSDPGWVSNPTIGDGTTTGAVTFLNNSASAKKFTLANGSWFTAPVPYIQPITDGGIALDLMAHGSTPATVFMSFVDRDIVSDQTNYEALTLIKNASGASEVKSNKAGSGTYRPLVLNKDGGFVSVGNNASPAEILDVTGGAIAVRGNIAGFASAASEGVFDFGGGATRVLSYGAGATYGTVSVIQSQSNNTGSRTVLSINTSGNTTLFGTIGIASSVPATSSAACTTGTVTWGSGFVYVCVSTNAWQRAAMATW